MFILAHQKVTFCFTNVNIIADVALSKKQLTEIFRTCKKNLKVNVIFKSPNRIRNAFLSKDIIPTIMNSKVVYRFKYNICNDVYVGKTKHHLLVRQYEHLEKSILTEKPSKYNYKDPTSIRKHYHRNNHQADSSCFTLISSASNNLFVFVKIVFVYNNYFSEFYVSEENEKQRQVQKQILNATQN